MKNKPTKHFRGSIAVTKSVDGARYAEGHLVRYGDIDDQDLEEEHFSKSTNFMRDANFPIKGRPALYEHGLTDFGAFPIGIFDFVDEDDIGLFVRAKLHEREDYERMLKEISGRKSLDLSPEDITRKAALAVKAVSDVLKNVKHQWSMGAYVPTVQVSPDGHIDQCGIVEGSLTVMPAEPNGTEARIYQKSLFEAFDLTAAATESIATGSVPKIDATKSSHSKSGAKQMDMQMFRDGLMALLSMVDQGAMEDDTLKMVDEEELEDEVVKAAEELLEDDKEATKMMDEDEDAVKMADKEDKKEAAKSARRHIEAWVGKNATEIFTLALANLANKQMAANSAFKSALPTKIKSKRDQAGAYGTGNNPAKAPGQMGKAEKPNLTTFVKSSLNRDFTAIYGKAQNPYIGTMGGDLLGQSMANEILPPLREQVVAFDAGVRQTNIGQGVGVHTVAKMTTAPSAHRPGINTAIVDSEAKFETITAFPRPIAAEVLIPFQLLNQSPLAVEQTIQREMIDSISLQIDKEIFVGEGTVEAQNSGAGIRGIRTVLEADATLSTTNVKTLATNGRLPKFSDASDAETQLAINNIPDAKSKAWVMHSRSRGRYRSMIDTTGDPLYRDNYGTEPYANLMGYPVHVANQLSVTDTTGTSSDTSEIYFGAWEYIEYVMQDSLEIIVDRVTLANELMARIIAYTYSDIIIHYPEAFYLMKGVR